MHGLIKGRIPKTPGACVIAGLAAALTVLSAGAALCAPNSCVTGSDGGCTRPPIHPHPFPLPVPRADAVSGQACSNTGQGCVTTSGKGQPPPAGESLPTITVSDADYRKALSKGRSFGPSVKRGNVYCHQVDQATWWVVTGQNSYYGGMYCHR